jgi:protein SCO1/2
VYDGEYRSWYESGHPFEVRHYRSGREEGLQQAWTDTGELYINYEARDGRHYGLLNSAPCTTTSAGPSPAVAGDEGRTSKAAAERPIASFASERPKGGVRSSLPYYDSASFAPHWSPVRHRVAPFSMTTQRGRTLSRADLDGSIYVASFIYTKCSALCPLLVGQLARVQQAIAPFANAKILSFSVTPDEDTPAALAAYGREHGIDAHRWLLLTGPRDTIYSLARTSFFADDSRVQSAADFLHTEKVLLVDGAGRLRGVYNGTQAHEIDHLIDDLRSLKLGISKS